jgi:hypothetical protein
MNDFYLFKKTIKQRLDDLEDYIINNGEGCEMGLSPDLIKEQFKWTKLQLGLELTEKIKRM